MNTILWAFFIITATVYAPPVDPAGMAKICKEQGGNFVGKAYTMWQAKEPESKELVPVEGIVVFCEGGPVEEEETPKQGA